MWRIHPAELEERRKSKTMDFIWTGNKISGDFLFNVVFICKDF